MDKTKAIKRTLDWKDGYLDGHKKGKLQERERIRKALHKSVFIEHLTDAQLEEMENILDDIGDDKNG